MSECTGNSAPGEAAASSPALAAPGDAAVNSTPTRRTSVAPPPFFVVPAEGVSASHAPLPLLRLCSADGDAATGLRDDIDSSPSAHRFESHGFPAFGISPAASEAFSSAPSDASSAPPSPAPPLPSRAPYGAAAQRWRQRRQ